LPALLHINVNNVVNMQKSQSAYFWCWRRAVCSVVVYVRSVVWD